MVRAWHSLDELESALPAATTEQIVGIASVLIDERAAAEAGGIHLTSFDQALALQGHEALLHGLSA